jgi:hypothetical protein
MGERDGGNLSSTTYDFLRRGWVMAYEITAMSSIDYPDLMNAMIRTNHILHIRDILYSIKHIYYYVHMICKISGAKDVDISFRLRMNYVIRVMRIKDKGDREINSNSYKNRRY